MVAFEDAASHEMKCKPAPRVFSEELSPSNGDISEQFIAAALTASLRTAEIVSVK